MCEERTIWFCYKWRYRHSCDPAPSQSDLLLRPCDPLSSMETNLAKRHKQDILLSREPSLMPKIQKSTASLTLEGSKEALL